MNTPTRPPAAAASDEWSGLPAIPDLPAATGPDAVRRALESARRMRGRRREDPDLQRRRRNRLANSRGRSPGYSGPAPDPIDPQRVGDVLAEYVADQGWDRPLAEARVFAEWPRLVGDEVSAHCEPVALRDGELRISAESTAWATQLRLLSATLLARLVAELGPQVVTKLVISGPTGPSWRHGRYSVRGARGPRDTYG